MRLLGFVVHFAHALLARLVALAGRIGVRCGIRFRRSALHLLHDLEQRLGVGSPGNLFGDNLIDTSCVLNTIPRDDRGCQDDEQLRLDDVGIRGPEEGADDREVSKERHLGLAIHQRGLDEAADDDRLPVADRDGRLYLSNVDARREHARGDLIRRARDLRDGGRDLQPHVPVAADRGRDFEDDTHVLSLYDRLGVALREELRAGDQRDVLAHIDAGRLVVVHGDVGPAEDFEAALGLERSNHNSEVSRREREIRHAQRRRDAGPGGERPERVHVAPEIGDVEVHSPLRALVQRHLGQEHLDLDLRRTGVELLDDVLDQLDVARRGLNDDLVRGHVPDHRNLPLEYRAGRPALLTPEGALPGFGLGPIQVSQALLHFLGLGVLQVEHERRALVRLD